MPPDITLIAAVARNLVIGSGGRMPWHLPSDLAQFRERTLDKPIVMGRKTFESNGRPLPRRTSIVVSRDPAFRHEGVSMSSTPLTALDLGRQVASRSGVDEVMIIGGAEIYRALIEAATALEITWVEALPDGDSFFPEIDLDVWLPCEQPDVAAHPGDTAPTTRVMYRRR